MKKESDDWDDIKVNRRSTDKVYFESPVIQSISDSIDFLRDETKEILKELDSTEFKQQIDEFDLEDFGEEAIDQISEIKDEISQFRAEIIDSDDVVFVVDELERSLHPKLTQQFLKLFNEVHKDRRMQLVITTHESTIMDQALFRRDEIWFIERDTDNRSRVYSLDRFKERYDKVLSKAYLEGRYGAIPVFKSFTYKEEE